MMRTTLESPRKGRFKKWLRILILTVVVVAAALAALRTGSPEIALAEEPPGIGQRTPFTATFTEGSRGLAGVRVELVQGDLVQVIEEREHEPRPFWAFWGPRVEKEEVAVEIGRETVPDLQQGEAEVHFIAERAATPLRSLEPARVVLTLPVRYRPPSLEVTSSANYVAQGGSAVVTYRVGPTAVRHGVEVGEHWFPGYPLPGGGDDERFALFGTPYDLDDPDPIRLVASDDLGNAAQVRFVDRYFEKPLPSDTIALSDAFMERVVPAILDRSPEVKEQDTLLESYLVINRDLRQKNAEALAALAEKTRPEFLWNQAFLQQPNTQSMASFAERRTYVYDGQSVDEQVHLGFDLASTKRASILASNSGVVLLAEFFGIYGNTVVIDHGYGLMSLYAHLSSFDVEPGQEVERGTVVGRSGETGLAGGDHLHFSMLLRDLQVSPVEWWDFGWIRDRVAAKLGPALELAES